MRFPDVNGGEREVLKKFSTRIQRGDRVGIIGPNGAGKTTLLKILLGQLQPTEGSVTFGTNLTPAIFDQHREQLDPDVSLWDTLADPASGQLIVQGEVRHVVAYLRDFLFEEKQAKSPVSALSGGEKNRLLLARLLARSSNLLVLDEPTNDLDMETLDLVISHDRDFLDQLVTSTIVIEGGGRASEYVGGYSDYMRARRADGEKTITATKPAAKAKEAPAREGSPRKKLSYKDQRDLDLLPGQIAETESKIAALEAALADPELFARDAAAFNKKAADLTRLQEEKDALETRWLELEILQEEISGG